MDNKSYRAIFQILFTILIVYSIAITIKWSIANEYKIKYLLDECRLQCYRNTYAPTDADEIDKEIWSCQEECYSQYDIHIIQ